MTTPQATVPGASDDSQPQPGAPAGNTPPSDPQPPSGSPGAGDGITNPEAKRYADEAAKERAARKTLEAKLAEYDAERQKAADAQLTEQQRLQKQLASAQEQIAALQVEQQSYRLAREIARHAPSLNLIDPDAAMLMLQAGGELEYDDEGHPKNVAKLLEKLVAEKPYLIASNVTRPTPPPSSGGATNPGRSALPQGQPQPARADPKAAYAAHRQGGGLANPNIWKR